MNQLEKPDKYVFFIRDFPLSLRNRAKSKAAALGISMKDFTMQALEEKLDRMTRQPITDSDTDN